ncbi:MAG: cellulase family glycosylhydrolase [Candidatus Moranbacteria bacterium]|nr:cellulase family glycosylhydrolase [Candidatus Moranbacteria bacterium]
MFLIKWLFKLVLKILIIVLILGAAIWLLFNWPVQDKNEDMKFGVSFAHHHAESLGLDWKETYLAILDDLDVKRVRIAAYWDRVEMEKGEYDFSDVDWQVEQARQRDVDVILAFGVKTPRWPECHIPEFYMENKEKREKALLEFEEDLVKRYKDYDNIIRWQVENEPFLPYFGDCPEGAVDAELVDKEIELVKELDPDRPIIVTDSGELSIWYEAAKRADIFGTTLYRIIHKPPFGYVEYPVGPNFFRLKAKFIEIFAGQDDVIISELQAEPWAKGWILHVSLEEQYKTMDPDKFRDIIEYAKKTKFDAAYLWGAEWWYWLKEKKDAPEMWEEAREVLK